MPAAARVTDSTAHAGVIFGLISGPGVATVLIGGLPAAVAADTHACALPQSAGGPHPPGPIGTGSSSVFIGGQPAVRVGDMTACGAQVVTGLPTVDIGG
jgi:uncharacterized Zn-binding protein involved in type VI secretion